MREEESERERGNYYGNFMSINLKTDLETIPRKTK